MLSAGSPEGARLLLLQHGQKLSDKSKAKIELRIQVLASESAARTHPRITLEDREAAPPSAANGYRSLDLDRVVALVYELASRCCNLYWTKLQRALFFADMICYERNSCSLTGLSYAHATFGPVMDRKDEVRVVLVNREAIDFVEDGWGEVLVPLQSGAQPFNAQELALIDEVARFVNSFSTAAELSDFSHKLTCWGKSADGEIIAYTQDDGEVGSAMLERMSAMGAS